MLTLNSNLTLTLTLTFLLSTSSLCQAALSGVPTVKYSGGQVRGVVPADPKALKREMRIIDAEECQANRVSNSLVKVPNRCRFLRGIFSYTFLRPGTSEKLQAYLGFTLTRKGPSSHVFMVSSPYVFPE